MFSIKRTVIGIVAAFAIGVFAIAFPVSGGLASADGGVTKTLVKSVDTKDATYADSDTVLINGIRCEDQDCLRTISKVAVPDGGTILIGGLVAIRCEDEDCF